MNYNMIVNLAINFSHGNKICWYTKYLYKFVAEVVAVGRPAASISNCVIAILAILS